MSPPLFKKFSLIFFLFAFYFLLFLFSAPADFPSDKVVEIKKGATLSEVAALLQNDRLVRSAFLFRLMVDLRAPRSGVIAGAYLFDRKSSLWSVASRLIRSDEQLLTRVFIREGLDNRELAKLFKRHLSEFDEDKFLSLAAAEEGYLFPDTYFFDRGVSEKQIIKSMRQNFSKKVGEVKKETLVMASILEEEARTRESRQIIAGILWKRLKAGVPLQVDATLGYLVRKGSLQLTMDDLSIDSPYNTYRYRGLPPGPITNPGLNAIMDAEDPKATPYWFYLSDRDGAMHYAVTFDEHKVNKFKYLP